MAAHFIGVDVGTGSARAGIFDAAGRLLGRAEAPLEIKRLSAAIAAQDSAQIWAACATALRAARAEAAASPDRIAGLGFDATCSIVVRDAAGGPVGVLPGEADRWNTILWLDHRARAEAAVCDATGHPVVAYAGGAMSPELAIPKLMWLKRRMPETWSRAAHIADLADFLTLSASGNPARSHCTLASKWTYLGSGTPSGWQPDFLSAIGLADLRDRAGLPERSTPIATDLGPLAPAAAAHLGLAPETRVATGLIDAHAGALGVLGHLQGGPAEHDLALIAGTSSCLMRLHRSGDPVPGLWGPFADVVLPGRLMSEGGQSASGALLDHLIRRFGGGLVADSATHARIASRIAALRADNPDLAPGLSLLPDFQGNRSPFADAGLRGWITGLDMEEDFDGLCRLYWRAAVALALGLRQVVEHFGAHGPTPQRLRIAGGHVRNALLTRLYADATGLPIELPEGDSVLLGTAMGAAVGAGLHPGLASACAAMHQRTTRLDPDPAAGVWLERDWRRFRTLQRHRAELAALG